MVVNIQLRVTETTENPASLKALSWILHLPCFVSALFSRKGDVNWCFFLRIGECNTSYLLWYLFLYWVYVSFFLYSTWITWMHKIKDICLRLLYICLEFHLFYRLRLSKQFTSLFLSPCCYLFHCAMEPFHFKSWQRRIMQATILSYIKAFWSMAITAS